MTEDELRIFENVTGKKIHGFARAECDKENLTKEQEMAFFCNVYSVLLGATLSRLQDKEFRDYTLSKCIELIMETIDNMDRYYKSKEETI
jgi:hypothetical protein